MLLVDEIEVVDGIAHSKYQVRGDEFFLQGHYPGNPIVPGVIQCEIMAQSCSLLLKDELIGKTPLYAGIDNVRFKQQVKPGDLFEVQDKLTDKRGHLYFCEAKGLVGGKMVIKGSLSFALIPNEQ